MASQQIEELKYYYNPAQILTDDIDILLTTIDGSEYQYYTMVTKPRPNKIRVKRNTKVEDIKAILAHWAEEMWDIDLEKFHGIH